MIGNAVAGIYAPPKPVDPLTGGTLFIDGGFNYRVFTSSGTLTCSSNTNVDILIVAGGAGGAQSGGGGAGGLRAFTSQALTATGYTITIGGGGSGQTGFVNGVDTSIAGSGFSTLTVSGGGGGAYKRQTAPGNVGNSGGSGGGGGPDDTGSSGGAGGAGNTGGYSPVEGYAGSYGLHQTPTWIAGGGGGGASSAATNPAATTAPNGGAGTNTYNSINFSTWLSATSTGVSGYLAGGGGGSHNNASYQGAGGSGGGGNAVLNSNGTNATTNSGSGGGAGAWNGGTGGNGGSGLFIVRYSV